MVPKTKKTVAGMGVLEEVREILSEPVTEKIILVDLGNIEPNPYQPVSRLEFAADIVDKMAASILEHGLILTPVVRAVPGGRPGYYEMADGWLRWNGYYRLATEKADGPFNRIPVIVRELTDRQMADMVMEANTVRKDLNPIELAGLYKKYLEDFKVTQTELAKSHNISQGQLANTMRLLELPEELQQMVIFQKISPGVALQLLRLNRMPEQQKNLAGQAVRYSYTVNQLDSSVNSILYQYSNQLASHLLDTKDCGKCEQTVMVSVSFNDKKEARCLDKACYTKKCKEHESAAAAKGSKKAGAGKILTHKDVSYDQKEDLNDYRLKQMDNPAECKDCEHTALYKYDAGDPGAPDKICLKPSCARAKISKKTRAEHAVAKAKDDALTAELAKTFRDPVDQKAAFLIIARHQLRMFNQDCKKDMLAFFPELKQEGKKSWDESAINDILEGWTAGNLARICAAAEITRSRRNTSGQYSPTLSKETQLEYSMLTGTLADYKACIIKLQEAQCKGCTRAISDNVGTGKECCSQNWSKGQRDFKEDGKCSERSTLKRDAPVRGPEEDEEDELDVEDEEFDEDE